MCWRSKEEQTVKIAEHDIRCFKICRYQKNSKCAVSRYQRMEYELGKEYVLQNNAIIFNTWNKFKKFNMVFYGFHSYAPSVKIIKGYTDMDFNEYHIKSESGEILDLWTADQEMAKYNCVIPKGSRYLVNENGELVSDRIIIRRCETKFDNNFTDQQECAG